MLVLCVHCPESNEDHLVEVANQSCPSFAPGSARAVRCSALADEEAPGCSRCVTPEG